MTRTISFCQRPGLLRNLLAAIIPLRPKPFLTLTGDGLELSFPLALKRTRLSWDTVDLLFATEKRKTRTIYVEFLKGIAPEYILEEIDDQRSSLEINRELARLGYLRSEASAEELEAARRDREQSS